MPIYEFVCHECNRKQSFLVRDISSQFTPQCSFCGSAKLSRAVSAFAYHRSLSTVWEESGEPTMRPGDVYYKDPRNIGRWAERKFQDMGQEMPSHLQEKIQAAREGILPEPLKDLESVSPTATYD
ncbi:MAG: FmdB family zinc ribbon protein [Dehalococcoidia bacterium]